MAVQERSERILQAARPRVRAAWHQFLPPHRMATVAKTPLLVAAGMYLSGGRFQIETVGLSMLLSAVLWAALYIQNESMDLAIEKGCIVSKRVQTLLFILPLAICLTGILISKGLLVLLVLMTIGQMAYCVPPLRLKRFWWAAPLLSGSINPLLRVQCGAIWGSHPIPLLAYAVVVCVHLSGAIRTRMLQRERDRKLGYKVAPGAANRAGAVIMISGLLGACCLCLDGTLPTMTLVPLLFSIGWAAYAWSGRVNNMAQLRKGWIWFAGMAVLTLIGMLYNH